MAVIHLVGDYSLTHTIETIKRELPKIAISLEFVDEGYINSDSISYLIVYDALR